MNRHARFTQAEVTRAVRGVIAAGANIMKVVVNNNGMELYVGDQALVGDDEGTSDVEAMIAKAQDKARK